LPLIQLLQGKTIKMVNIDLGWLRTANGLVMLLNLVAAVAAIVFWEIHYSNHELKNRNGAKIYYTCACVVALIIVAVVFFLTLCGKLTKRILAIIFLIIAAILIIAAVVVALADGEKSYRTFSLMSAAVLAGGIIANVVYTGVGGLRITT